MGLSENEKKASIVTLSLVGLLFLAWLVERGEATAVAIFLASLITLLAAIITAKLGISGYRAQKDEDRKEELTKRRQHEYERYITAFGNASRWKGQVNNWSEVAVTWKEAADRAQNTNDMQQRDVLEKYEHALDRYTHAQENHEQAEAEYHEAHTNLLPIGSDKTIMAVNDFYRYFISDQNDPLETKIRYARMLIEMRKDSFEETSLSVKGVAMNIPWTVGVENKDPIDWNKVNENGDRL